MSGLQPSYGRIHGPVKVDPSVQENANKTIRIEGLRLDQHMSGARDGKKYTRMQQLWDSDMTKAAKMVLDGDFLATVFSMEEMVDFWTTILTMPTTEIELKLEPGKENPELRWIAAPITFKEIQVTEDPLKSAPGPDKIIGRQCEMYSLCFKRCFTIHS